MLLIKIIIIIIDYVIIY